MRSIFRFLFVFLFSVVVVAGYNAAHAQEVIENYNVDIEVDSDGGILVHEQIRVYAMGHQIQRGIYRDWPARGRGFLGTQQFTDYQILEVKRDGRDEAHHTQNMGNTFRLYIGSANTYLTPASYTYDIKYYVPDQISYYDEFDELYWNAIGTEWIFPIQQAQVTVRFPGNVGITQYSVYTGPKGARGQNFVADVDGGLLSIQTKRAMSPYNGLTFAAAIPKGIIQQPKIGFLGRFNRAHPGFFFILLGLIATVYWVRHVWERYGVDPVSRGNAPFYTPPESISAAEAAYIKAKGRTYGSQLLPITLIALASKGFLHIRQEAKGGFYLEDTGEGKAFSELSFEEQRAYNFVKGGYKVKAHDYEMIRLSSLIYRNVEKACKGRYFKFNYKQWALSLVPMLLVMAALPFVTNVIPSNLSLLFFQIILAAFVCMLPLAKMMFKIFTGTWYVFFKVLSGFVAIVVLALLAALIGDIWVNIATSYLVIFLGLLILFVSAYAQPLMEALTPKGRDVIDHLKGLELYMSAVEGKILEKFDPPQMSRELYEELFPYAVALGVESKWGDKFLAGMAAATVAGVVASADHIQAAPRWYSSSSSSKSMTSDFSAGHFFGDFASNVRAASTARSSSSSSGGGFSSGGGSSGGGGGGGGGGGW